MELWWIYLHCKDVSPDCEVHVYPDEEAFFKGGRSAVHNFKEIDYTLPFALNSKVLHYSIKDHNIHVVFEN